jgi:four helix bundle protein
MKDNVIQEKSFAFAVQTVNLFKSIKERHREFVLSKQFLRSGTSIGACIREAINAESRPDFVHKLGIAQKECDETIYWIELLYATSYITKPEMVLLKSESEEILRILRSIILSTKKTLKSNS